MADIIDLSICIVSYNVRDYLRECLDSIFKYPAGNLKLEVIVVDNGSKDDSADMVKESFPSAKIFPLGLNRGFSAANNVALKEATGDYLLLLNPDTKLSPNCLHVLVDYLKSHPECGIVGPKLLNGDGSLQNGLRKFPTTQSVFIRNTPLKHLKVFKRKIREYHMRDFDLSKSGFVDQVSGAAMMFSKKTFQKLGFLDERFYIYFEEVDYCRRAVDLGLKVFYNTEAEIIHYGGKSSVQLSGKIKYIHMESQYKYLRKHFKLWNNHLFLFLIKSVYLTVMLAELVLDIVFVPLIRLILFLFPAARKSKKLLHKLSKADFRLYFFSKKLFVFLGL